MNVVAVIPARFASQRLPGKPIIDIAGVPLVIRVWKNVCQSTRISKVLIACDDERIADVCKKYGADYVLTDTDLPSGTDRIYSALKLSGLQADLILNVQGDEPFINSDDLDYLIDNFINSGGEVGTLIKKISDTEELFNPNVVKVVKAANDFALYFSRSPIPYFRDLPNSEWINKADYNKHIGVYLYKLAALEAFSKLPVSNLESIEKLEQLRLMEKGFKYLCVETNAELIGVDTPEDVIKAELRLKERL